MKINIKSYIVFVIALLILVACAPKEDNKAILVDEPTISVMPGCYSIDVQNHRELAGDADYVIKGQVVRTLDTEYRHPVEGENEDGSIKILTDPYTNYEVQVLENLKGSLNMEGPIIIAKNGGVREDNSEYVLYENDLLPEEGNTYIFYVYAQEDGSNGVSGQNSTIPIDISRAPRISACSNDIVEKSKTIILEVQDGVDNEIVSERIRFVSDDELKN